MKKVLIVLLSVFMTIFVSSCDMAVSSNIDKDTFRGKECLDWTGNGVKVGDNIYNDFKSVESHKVYNSQGDLDFVTKSSAVYMYNTSGSDDSSLKTKKFTSIDAYTGCDSDSIDSIMVAAKDSPRSINDILFLVKDAFGECDSSKITTKGSKKWPYSYSISYQDKINGVNFDLTYIESSDYHLGSEYGYPYLTITYSKID